MASVLQDKVSSTEKGPDNSGEISIQGVIPYIDPDLTRVLADLSERWTPPPLDRREVPIFNARNKPTSLEVEGFELYRHSSSVASTSELLEANRTFRQGVPEVSRQYQNEILPLLEEISQAREVMPFISGLVVRFSDRHAERTWQPAVSMVHLDMTSQTVHSFIKFAFETENRELKPYRRAVVYQVWQAISPPPQDSMVAFCDGRTCSDADTVPMDVIFAKGDKPNEQFLSRGVKYNPSHRWHYFPDLTSDELIVFIGYDTDKGDTMNVAHTAFDNPEGGVPRNSVECRFIALYD